MKSEPSRPDWTSAPTIPARFAREMIGRPRFDADEIDRILGGTDLTTSILRRGRFRLSARQFLALYNRTVIDTDDELFRFMKRPVPRGAYITLMKILTRAPKISDCIGASIDYYRLYNGAEPWRLTVSDETVHLDVQPQTKAQSRSILFLCIMLISAWRSMGWLANQSITLHAVTLDPQFESLASELRFLYGAQPKFRSATAQISFQATVLDLPVARRPEDAEDYGGSSLVALLSEAPRSGLEGRIRSVLASRRPFASASAQAVAAELGLSPSTLQRRLQKLGLTFQSVKDDLRRDRAITLLADASRTVSEIAAAIGYSEASAFQRAFKVWTGAPPGQYRPSS